MNDTTSRHVRERRLVRSGLVAGLGAGAAMILATVALRLVVGASTLTELAADRFTELLPPPAIDFLLETLSFSAKPLMFAGLLIAQAILGGLLGALYSVGVRRWPVGEGVERVRATAFGLLLWLLAMVALTPALGGGVFGTAAPGSTPDFLFASVVPFVVYGISLWAFRGATGAEVADEARFLSRRAFLRRNVKWLLIGAAVVFGLRFVFGQLSGQLSPSGTFRVAGTLSSEVTPNDKFYVVSKNILDPQVNLDSWALGIGGLVTEPATLSLEQLRAMPSKEEFVTLECVSNRVGGDLISNAKWRGVPLRDLLDKAGLQPGVVDISFQAWDEYSESIPLDMALSDEVMVAYEMNGEPLPHTHGLPVRLIVPGFFGLKHVKWLTAIEPVAEDFQGYWQRRGWTDEPWVKTFSRFDTPGNRAEVLDASVLLSGVAFSGNRGIARVEVSDDGGRTWFDADDVSTPLSPYTWVLWQSRYTPRLRTDVVLQVRATADDGAVQTAETRGTLPDGATGHHEIQVRFRNPPGQ